MKELLEATELTVVPQEKLGAVQAKKDKQKNSKKLYQQLATVPTFNLPLDHKEIAAINKLAAPIRAITLLEFLNHAGIEQIKVHLSNT